MHCNGLNSIRATQMGLSRTCHGQCRKHLDILQWFMSATFVICVHDFPHGKVSVKVGVMEFGLKPALITVYLVPSQTAVFTALQNHKNEASASYDVTCILLALNEHSYRGLARLS